MKHTEKIHSHPSFDETVQDSNKMTVAASDLESEMAINAISSQNSAPHEDQDSGMSLILQTSDVIGNSKNCLYPNRVEIHSAEELQEAVKMDHVCAEYVDNRRSTKNFRQSNVVVMDCDNSHTENPAEWITPEKLNDMMPRIRYAIAFSRHHMKEKDGKAPRPKFHVYFEIKPTSDAERYAALKKAIFHKYAFFDGNALDAGRFIFGADTGSPIWHDGELTIDNEIRIECSASDKEESHATAPVAKKESDRVGNTIIQGTRNKTMSQFADRILLRFGNTEKTQHFFSDEAKKCDPPLDDEELSTIWFSAVRWYETVASKQQGYIPPDRYNSAVSHSLTPQDYSDIGEAKVLAQEYRQELKFSDSTSFIRYNGIYWQESNQMAVGTMMELLDLQLFEAEDKLASTRQALLDRGVPEEAIAAGGKKLLSAVAGNEELMKLCTDYMNAQKYHAFVMKHRDNKYVMSSLNQAKPLLLLDINQLDADPYLLNTPEATYDLRKGLDGAREHASSDYLTKCTNASPGEAGKNLWLETVNRVFCNDQELIDYVQSIVGMAVVGKVFSEALIISYGDGANGKSTFWNTLARVLGSYSGMMSADALTVGCKRNVRPEMAELKGKRLIIAAELEEGTRLSTSTVKQLCSTDEIAAEKKYKDPFKFIPTHTLVLYTNHLPKVGAGDNGTWRRLIVIPFNAKIQGKSDIKNYTDYLVENAGPYIMSWIIEGAKKAIDAEFKFSVPRCVEKAINDYREGNNWMGEFLEECCDTGPELKEKSGLLYKQYRTFSAENGELARNTTDFYSALDRAGFERKHTRDGVIVLGIKLKSEMNIA